MIELDGSHEEGGGQILRTALGLSVITGKAFRISNIRKDREQPGLKPQHLACIKACTDIAGATVIGANPGSYELEFLPRSIKNRQMEINIGTAGSITLFLQSIMLPAIFTECSLRIIGGTDVKWSMPLDYFQSVMVPILSEYCTIQVTCAKRGYYPLGGGVVDVKTSPKYKRLNFDDFPSFYDYIFGHPIKLSKPGKVIRISGVSHASLDLQDTEVAERQAKTASLLLGSIAPTHIQTMYFKSECTGSGITLWNIHDGPYRLGADAIGEKRLKAEEVGRVAATELAKNIASHITVDEHLQDNLIPLLGLFGGRIKSGEITAHTKANIAVCNAFLGVNYAVEPANAHSDERAQPQNNLEDETGHQSEANFISVLSSKTP